MSLCDFYFSHEIEDGHGCQSPWGLNTHDATLPPHPWGDDPNVTPNGISTASMTPGPLPAVPMWPEQPVHLAPRSLCPAPPSSPSNPRWAVGRLVLEYPNAKEDGQPPPPPLFPGPRVSSNPQRQTTTNKAISAAVERRLLVNDEKHPCATVSSFCSQTLCCLWQPVVPVRFHYARLCHPAGPMEQAPLAKGTLRSCVFARARVCGIFTFMKKAATSSVQAANASNVKRPCQRYGQAVWCRRPCCRICDCLPTGSDVWRVWVVEQQ